MIDLTGLQKGRIVWVYHRAPHETEIQSYAAIVTHVYEPTDDQPEEGHIDATLFRPAGQGRVDVVDVPPDHFGGADGPSRTRWDWPPRA